MVKIKNSIIFIIIMLNLQLYSQLFVDNIGLNNDVTYLVNNILLGEGVTATNITVSGNWQQYGFFKGNNSNIGLDSGIIMSTGKIHNVVNNTNVSSMNGPGDIDLLSIAQSVAYNPQSNNINITNDLVVIEFDFVPTGKNLSFDFVFASEEYLTFINTVYNDIFAFFLSGPGIVGPYSSPAAFPNGAINIALIPNTTDPITISSVNPNVNSQYYINNPQQNNTNHYINGFTTVLTAQNQVECGQTYHIKLALADCQDEALDSQVFLKSGSFKSPNGVAFNSNLINNEDIDIDSSIMEGCGSVNFNIIRQDSIGEAKLILNKSGTATNGIDYTSIPDTIYFADNQSINTITIEAIIDNNEELIDSIVFKFESLILECDTIYFDDKKFQFYVLDNYINYSKTNDTTLTCIGDSVKLFVDSIKTPLNYYEITWENGDSIDFIKVSPDENKTYYFTLTDSCKNINIVDSIKVKVNKVNKLNIDYPDTIIACNIPNYEIIPKITGGTEPYKIIFNNSIINNTFIDNSLLNNTVYIKLNDYCDLETLDTVYVIKEGPKVDFDYLFIDDNTVNFNSINNESNITNLYWIIDQNTQIDTIFDKNFKFEFQSEISPYIVKHTIIDSNNCKSEKIKEIYIDHKLYIPNTITLNDDNINDKFRIISFGITDFEIFIFNRWGELLYNSSDKNFEWDCKYKGKYIDNGVYVYKIKYKDFNENIFEKTNVLTIYK